MELTSLSPSSGEVAVAVVAIVTLLFVGYAALQMVTRRWDVRFGLTLVLLTVVVPLAGPVVLTALHLWRRAQARRIASPA